MSLWEDCIYWPAAGFSSEVRAGVDPLKTSPARKCRARGRIEQTLLDGEFSVRPNRPKTFARYQTIPQKVTNVSIYDKAPEPCSKASTPARSIRVLLAEVPYLVRRGRPDVPTGARREVVDHTLEFRLS